MKRSPHRSSHTPSGRKNPIIIQLNTRLTFLRRNFNLKTFRISYLRRRSVSLTCKLGRRRGNFRFSARLLSSEPGGRDLLGGGDLQVKLIISPTGLDNKGRDKAREIGYLFSTSSPADPTPLGRDLQCTSEWMSRWWWWSIPKVA